jgi:UDPglucose--hexose-1-phosphate uridylyltransferase
MAIIDLPHRRFNPLLNEWVLVSPHRAKRPWQGQIEKTPIEFLPPYDPTCYLCPGNDRAGGKKNPVYTSTFVFDNDFPALLPPIKGTCESNENMPLMAVEQVSGICRVVCFSPRHDLSLPELSQEEVLQVIETWAEQTRELSENKLIKYVQVFENKGAMMGCSNPHPHSQIWATSYLPNEPSKEIAALTKYRARTGSCMLCDYLKNEHESKERLVADNDYFTALVPFWAVWPFEVFVISHRHVGSLVDLKSMERLALADILRRVTTRYDNLFEISFPYSMGLHQTPSDGSNHADCHFHAHFYPPLLRSATVRKFMVGFEMLAMPQRDLTPETAAERLRSLSEIYFKPQ